MVYSCSQCYMSNLGVFRQKVGCGEANFRSFLFLSSHLALFLCQIASTKNAQTEKKNSTEVKSVIGPRLP